MQRCRVFFLSLGDKQIFSMSALHSYLNQLARYVTYGASFRSLSLRYPFKQEVRSHVQLNSNAQRTIRISQTWLNITEILSKPKLRFQIRDSRGRDDDSAERRRLLRRYNRERVNIRSTKKTRFYLPLTYGAVGICHVWLARETVFSIAESWTNIHLEERWIVKAQEQTPSSSANQTAIAHRCFADTWWTTVSLSVSLHWSWNSLGLETKIAYRILPTAPSKIRET